MISPRAILCRKGPGRSQIQAITAEKKTELEGQKTASEEAKAELYHEQARVLRKENGHGDHEGSQGAGGE